MNRRDLFNALVLTSTGSLPVSVSKNLFTEITPSQGNNIDNTPQIQSAIDSLERGGGGILFLPSGTYRVRELRIGAHVRLAGLGQVTLKLFDPGRDGYIARIVGKNDIIIECICFDCTTESGYENTTGCIEVVYNANVISRRIIFSNCIFKNAQNNAWIILRRVDDVRIEQCKFFDHLRETSGATHGLSIAEDSRAIRVFDCLFDHPSGYRSSSPSKGHIGIDRATDVWIERCIIRRAPLNGITIEDNQESLLQSVRIRDCSIHECSNSGIQIEGNGLLYLRITNCDIRHNYAYGIRLSSGKECTCHIDGCSFDNNGYADRQSGSSQLLINLKKSHIAHVTNCNFHIDSNVDGIVHLYYLNGEASVSGCSFWGAARGFGIYAAVDAEKQQQRTTAAFRDLRFMDVGTPTFRLPQHAGRSWLNTKEEQHSIETLLTMDVQRNSTDPFVDIWIPVIGDHDRGAMQVSINMLIAGSAEAKAAHFQITAERDSSGMVTLSPATQSMTMATKGSASEGITALNLSAEALAEQRASRVRLHLRISAPSTNDSSPFSVTASLELLWSGFATAPVFV